MGRKKKENPLDYINLPNIDMNPEVKKNVWALFILAIAIVSFLGLLNNGGLLGDYLKTGLTWLFGWGRWLLPISFFVWAIFIFFIEKLSIKALHYIGLVLFFISTLCLLQLIVASEEWPTALAGGQGGGHLGYWLGTALVKAVGLVASYIISFFIGLISVMFIFDSTLAAILDKTSRPFKYVLSPAKSMFGWFGKKESSVAEAMEDEEEEHEEEPEEEHEEDEINEENNEEGDIKFEQRTLPMSKPVADEAVNIWYPTGVNLNIPIELLENRIGKPKSGDVKECGRIIQATLSTFGIPVEMDEVSVGPTVTQYSLRPADGVKLSKIVGLQTNLSMALAAHAIRIEAPIPGKSLVGIEVPNKVIATVGLREIITSEQFKSKGNKLTFALGKDVANKPWVTTIDTMPHLLVAGQTGSGKSVMINSIILSLLYNNNPDDLRMIMIDPKRVELTQYNGIPHLLTPVITDVSKTINALKWTINEMDRRLRLFEKYKKKDIISFNQVAKQKLPYIIFIIDELADLMMLSGKEVEPGIVRIAQMARAAGIHLILATQRPSVNVITGLIKANMPARIAFAVQSQIDSRTILDGSGAEKLLGRGDMLFTSASMSKPKRIQGSFVSEKEIKRVVTEIKRQAGKPQYLDGITEKQKVAGSMAMGAGMSGGDDDDPLLEEAKEIIINAGKASATMLQKYLSIGYARASRIMDLLEEQGIIGPGRGAKPREILVNKGEYSAGMTMSGMPLHNPAEMQAPEEYFEEVADDEDDNTADAESFGVSKDEEVFVPEDMEDEDNEPEDEIEDDEEEDNEPIENDIEEVKPIFTEPENENNENVKKHKNSFADMEEEDPSVVEVKSSRVSKTASAKSSGVSTDEDFDHYFSR